MTDMTWQSDIKFRIFSGAEIFSIGIRVWDAILARATLVCPLKSEPYLKYGL